MGKVMFSQTSVIQFTRPSHNALGRQTPPGRLPSPPGRPPPQIQSTVGGMHPTGMYTCSMVLSRECSVCGYTQREILHHFQKIQNNTETETIFTKNKTNKKAFQYDAYRPLANCRCFGGHQISVTVAGCTEIQ